MSILERINADYLVAYKEKKELTVSALRLARTALKTKEKEGKGELNDETVIGILKMLAKQRKEAAEQYRKGNREDLAKKEEAELEVLNVYLPAQIDEETIKKTVGEVISELKADSMKDMGRVMKECLNKLGSGADGKIVNQAVRELLQK